MKSDVLNEIIKVAKKYNTQKVVLFGSRARKDNTEVSDYDIAVFNERLSEIDKARFNLDIEEIQTLKKIDIVFVNENLSDILIKNIKEEGIVIYEQA